MTIIQQEYLAAVVAMVGRDEIRPEEVRRNRIVSEVNLIVLKNQTFACRRRRPGRIRSVRTVSKVLGPGGYNAMRGQGRITVRVPDAGTFRFCDEVVPITESIGHADCQK